MSSNQIIVDESEESKKIPYQGPVVVPCLEGGRLQGRLHSLEGGRNPALNVINVNDGFPGSRCDPFS